MTPTDILAYVTAVATSISAFGILIAAIVAARQLNRYQRATAIATMVQLLKDWDDAPTRAIRGRAADKLLADPPLFDRDTVDLLNIFETIAFLVVIAGVVGEEEAWTAFCEPVTFWVGAARPFLDQFRAGDPTYFDNAIALEKRLLHFDARRRGITVQQATPGPERIAIYLGAESRLPRDPGQPRVLTFAPGSELHVRMLPAEPGREP